MKKHLLKSMLVMAMMALGANAWAADFDLTGYTLAKTYDFSGYSSETAIEIGSAVTTKCWDNGNGQYQTMYPVTSPEGMDGLIVQSKANKGFIIGANSGLYSKGAARCAGIEGLTKGQIVVLSATQDIDNVISLIKTHAKGDNLPDGNYNFAKSDDGKVYFCAMTDDGYLGYHNLNGKQAIAKIEVYTPNEGTNIANYTVKFVDTEGTELLEAKTYSSAVGMQCRVFPADLQNITINEQGYLVDSNDAAEKTVAADGSTVVTVTYKAVAPVPYTVNEICGDIVFRTTTGEAYTGTTIKVPYRYYNAAEGKLYKKTQTNKEFNYSFNLTKENQVENLAYTATETENIVFISEGEDIEGLVACNSSNTGIRSSNSSSAYAPADTKITSLPAGKYKIYTAIYDASKTPDSYWVFKAGAIEVANLHCTTVNIQELSSDEFAIGKETDIVMAKAGSNNMGLDLIYIQKTGDVTAEEAVELNAAADLAEAKAELQEAITAAEAIDTTEKEGAEDLASAIAAAKNALSDTDATVESLNTAKAALEDAVEKFNNALVVVPETATVEDWTLEGSYKTSWGGAEALYATQVAFDGNDVYIQGLFYDFAVTSKKEHWAKGTISDGKVILKTGQLLVDFPEDGEKFYLVGSDDMETVSDIVFDYDTEAKTLTAQTKYILCNYNVKDAVNQEYLTWYENVKLYAGAPVVPVPVTAPEELVTETWNVKSTIYYSEEESDEYATEVQVGFDGDDAYIQGIDWNAAALFIKATKNADGKYVVPAMQYMGEIGFWSKTKYYFTAIDENGEFVDAVFSYNENTQTFSTEQTLVTSKSQYELTASVTLKGLTTIKNPNVVVAYSWDAGTEVGGKAVASDGESVGYSNAGNTTIRLNGKADYSTNYVTITLDEALAAGDVIYITAYRNKDTEGKKSGAKITFDAEGSEYITTGDGLEFVNINEAVKETSEYATEPNTVSLEVAADAAGSKVLTLTRSQTQTNLFITNIDIVKGNGETVGINAINATTMSEGIYTLSGQKVTNLKKGGIYIVNGKKVVMK